MVVIMKIKNSLLDTHIIKSKKNNLILFSNETNTNHINSTITDFYNWFDVPCTCNFSNGSSIYLRNHIHRQIVQRP